METSYLKEIKATIPGSYDPLTLGHLNIIKRAAKIFSKVIVGVGLNTSKSSLFTTKEKLKLIQENINDQNNVFVVTIPKLTVDFMKSIHSSVIVRGIRNVKDYEYERDIAEINRRLGEVETILLPSRAKYQDISSSNLKEVAKLGADISHFVPKNVAYLLKTKLKK